jgi:hypothetical protein
MKRLPIISRRAALPLVLWLAVIATAAAQESDMATPASGLHVRSFSGYAVYYSNSLPHTLGSQAIESNLLSDAAGGASAELAWTHYAERTSFSLIYIPSYTGHLQYSGWNAFNQRSSFQMMRKLAPRWTLTFSGAADLSTTDQFLFAPTTLGAAAEVPAKSEDLATAMLSGRFNDPRLAPVLGGAQVSQSPLQVLLYGDRVLNTAAQASLAYSYSPRLSVVVNGGGNRSQHVSQNTGPAGNGLLSNTTSENLSVGLSYSLSPRTQIGGTVTGARSESLLQDNFTTTSVGTLGRKLSTKWFVQVQGGVGVMKALRDSALEQRTVRPHPVIGGSLGYKSFSHTLLSSYDRAVSDAYGLGASTSSSASGSWLWRRPGSDWSLTASGGWQKLEGTLAGTATGWRTTAGIGRSLGHVTLLVEYAYLKYSGIQQQTLFLSQSAVRVSTRWRPNPALLR